MSVGVLFRNGKEDGNEFGAFGGLGKSTYSL